MTISTSPAPFWIASLVSKAFTSEVLAPKGKPIGTQTLTSEPLRCSPATPPPLYGIAKNALRETTFLSAKAHDAVAQWIRAYYIVGDDKFGNSIFSKLLEAAEEGRTTFPFTTGKNRYDFISVDELATQIAAIVDQTEVDGIINACTGEPMSLAERVEAYIRDNNLNISLEYGAFPDRPYDSPGVWGDPTKIRRILASSAG